MQSANYGPTQPLEANNFHLVLHCLQYVLDQIFAIHQYKDKDTFQERACGISDKTKLKLGVIKNETDTFNSSL